MSTPADTFSTRDYDWSVEQHESLTSLRERLAVEGAAYLGHVREIVDQRRLDDTFTAHRRTLVALALASHGVDELGWGDPMLWVAQPG